MTPNDIRQAYTEKQLSEVHQMYRDFEDKSHLDENNYGESLLHIAATYADAGAIAILLEAGVSPNITTRYGDTALHVLAEQKMKTFYKVPAGATKEAALKLLEARVSPLRKNDEGQTCLHTAARWGRYELFEALVEKGSKLDMADKNGNLPLHIICEYSGRAASSLHYAEQELTRARETAARETHKIYQERVEYSEQKYAKDKAEFDSYFLSAKILIEAGIDVDEKNNYGQTAQDMLNENDRKGDKRIAALIGGFYSDDGGDENSEAALRLKTGGMSLHQAIEKDDHDSVRANIALGADVNELYTTDSEYDRHYGLTPLGLAICKMDVEVVELLLEAGANPNFKSGDGKTPMSAFFYGPVGINLKMFEEKRPARIMKAMKEHGLNIDDFIDEDLNTPLNKCCRDLGHSSGYNSYRLPGVILELLLEWGADIHLANAKGVTPLMNISACDEGGAENFQVMLLEAGAVANARDAEGNTPLMYAARHRNKAMAKNMVDMLFSFGDPEPQAVNNDGVSALEIVTQENNEPLVKYLLGKM